MDFFRRFGLYFAWLLSCIGLLGAIYFSDFRHIEPCHLCWYQRICLFPLTILLAIAICRNDRKIALYTLPQSFLGLFLSLYQIGIQEIPGWNPIEICGAGPSCSEKIYIGLGPFTVPMLAAVGFLGISIFLYGVFRSEMQTHLFNDIRDD